MALFNDEPSSDYSAEVNLNPDSSDFGNIRMKKRAAARKVSFVDRGECRHHVRWDSTPACIDCRLLGMRAAAARAMALRRQQRAAQRKLVRADIAAIRARQAVETVTRQLEQMLDGGRSY